MLFVFVIMLNLAIAVVTDTYAEVKRTKEVQFRIERGSMLVEVEVYPYFDRRRPNDQWIILLSSDGRSNMVEISQDSMATRLSKILKEVQIRHQNVIDQLQTLNTQMEEIVRTHRYASITNPDANPSSEGVVETTRTNNTGFDIRSFGFVPTQLELEFPTNDSRSGLEYHVSSMKNHPFLGYLDQVGLIRRGKLSKLVALAPRQNTETLGLDIPAKSVYYAMASPLAGVGRLSRATMQQDLMSADSSFMFLVLGGLVFLDDKLNILKALAYVFGGDTMTFDSRKDWKFPELTRRLHEERRFNRVTLDVLLDEGAQLFAWISPGETVNGSSADSPWPFGAFVYLFHEDPYEVDTSDCYFAVSRTSAFAEMMSGA